MTIICRQSNKFELNQMMLHNFWNVKVSHKLNSLFKVQTWSTPTSTEDEKSRCGIIDQIVVNNCKRGEIEIESKLRAKFQTVGNSFNCKIYLYPGIDADGWWIVRNWNWDFPFAIFNVSFLMVGGLRISNWILAILWSTNLINFDGVSYVRHMYIRHPLDYFPCFLKLWSYPDILQSINNKRSRNETNYFDRVSLAEKCGREIGFRVYFRYHSLSIAQFER